MKLNETPVRTSRNFNINDIDIDDLKIIDKSYKFENLEIFKSDNNIKITEDVSQLKTTYKLNDDLINEVSKNSNKKLKMKIDGKNEKELRLDFKFDKNNFQLIDNIEIDVCQYARATIAIKYESNQEFEAYHNCVLRINAGKNSKIDVVYINLMNNFSNNFVSIENTLEKDSELNFIIVDLGGKNSVTNYYSNLIGDNSKNMLSSIYLGKDDQLIDLNYIGKLRGENTKINIEVQGAIKDCARKHFKGTIDFKKGCKKAVGNENESCMLLSDKAKSLALPMLLCSEEDVEGNHSTSSGKIGEKELFYIMSRGFELKEAQKLMVKAKFNKILNEIKNEEIRNRILYEIDAIL